MFDSDIKTISENFLSKSLLFAIVLGLLGTFFSFYQSHSSALYLNIFFELPLLLILGIAFLKRESISLKAKTIVVVLWATFFIFIDVIGWGISSYRLPFLLIVPLFSLIAFSFRQTLLVLSLLIFIYLFFTILYGMAIIQPNFQIADNAGSLKEWISYGIIGSLISFILLLILEKFRRVNHEYLQREKSYKEIFDTSTDLISIHDEQGKVEYSNRRMQIILGYGKGKFENKKLNVIDTGTTPYIKDNALFNVNEVLEKGGKLVEWQAVSKSGNKIWVEVSLKTVMLKGRKKIVAFGRDITHKKAFEKELISTKNTLEAAIAQSPSGIIIADAPHVNIRIANKAAFGIRGTDNKVLTGIEVENHSKNWNTYLPNGEIYPPDQLPLSRAVLEGVSIEGEELIIIDSENKERWIMANAAPIYNDNNEITGGIVIFQDITESKKTREALLQSENKFRTLAENIPGTIYLCKNDDRYTMLYLSKEVYVLTGYTKDEFIGGQISFFDIFHPEDKDYVVNSINEAVENNAPFHLVYRIKHKNGSWVWIEEHGIGVFETSELLYLEGFIINITEKKASEFELEKYKKDLEFLVKDRTEELEIVNEEIKATNEELYSKNKLINSKNNDLIDTLNRLRETQAKLFQAEKMASLGVLTAGVAHEINNPLNYINGGYLGLQMYFKNPEAYKGKVEILLRSIKTGVERASEIVKGLSQFSRENESYDEICDIHSIINNCLTMLQNSLKNKVKITKNYATHDILLIGNVGKLHQVFINLLTNAEHAIQTKGNITITTKKINKEVIVEIDDDGIGISQENLNKITDPFFTTKDPGIGTGLGLSISYKIIREHNGSIDFESELSKGTRVTITFNTELHTGDHGNKQ